MTDIPGAKSPRAAAAFLAVAAELALVMALVRLTDLGGARDFFPLMCLVCAGFAVHAWLPQRWRLGFFCLLCLAGLAVFLGWPAAPLALLIGGGLVGLCHLPVPLYARAGLLLVAGVLLAACRVRFPLPFWPIVASMFMFRAIIYLYDLQYEEKRPGVLITFAYFFPLPNLCFPLFPVLDFRTFQDTYSPARDYALWQTGVEWIRRGLVHLLLYRAVRYFLMPEPHQMAEVPYLALYLACNYALYLQVSGWFHIITGILHLFGFGLPRTHDNYFLASSFTDIWRRINIYWKDFMTKIFFLPAFFRLRRWGTGTALVVSTMGVFVATWLLHSYQLFWLVGNLSLDAKEAILWLTVGVLAAVNLVWEMKRAGRPRERSEYPTVAQALSRSLRVTGMFLLVSFFWAVWTIPGFLPGLSLLALDPERTLDGTLRLGAVLLGVVVTGTLAQLAWGWVARLRPVPAAPSFARSVGVQLGVLGALVALALPAIHGRMGGTISAGATALCTEGVTRAEAGQIVGGYYEEVAVAPAQSSPLLGLLGGRVRGPAPVTYTQMSMASDDYLEREPIPGWRGEIAGSRLSFNSQGMRDREGISEKKPPGTRRVALIGSSVVMGYGVPDGEEFARRVENGLNAEGASGKIELLNFGTGLSYAIHRRTVLERKAFGFDPDVVWYFAHQDEFSGPPRHLARLLARGNELIYPSLREVARRANLPPSKDADLLEMQLQPWAREIVTGMYREIVQECRRRGVLPVWVYLPMPGVVEVRLDTPEVVKLARDAGFMVMDLSDWAEGHRPADVKLPGASHHANALGHRLIAERLLREVRARPELLGVAR